MRDGVEVWETLAGIKRLNGDNGVLSPFRRDFGAINQLQLSYDLGLCGCQVDETMLRSKV